MMINTYDNVSRTRGLTSIAHDHQFHQIVIGIPSVKQCTESRLDETIKYLVEPV